MKKNFCLTILLCLFLSATAFAQKISKPTLTPVAATAAQKQIINEGTKLHDAGQYDEAIGKYTQVLTENPDSDEALYEMAITYYSKKDMQKAVETAYKLVKYKSDLGALGYGLIANVLDDTGKPKEAIQIYLEAIKQQGDSVEAQGRLSSLYYNLGITYLRQKQYIEAREASKKSVQFNFSYPSPNYILAIVYQGTKYKVPALLAAARLISLELNTQRTKQSAAIFLDTLKSAKKDEKTGNINIFLDMNAPKDEGDFGMYDLFLGTLTTVKSDEDKNLSENEVFAKAVDTLISLLGEDKKLTSTFVGKTYVPFMVEMKKRGYSKTFAYLVLQQSGNKDAEKWLVDNSQQSLDFMNWAKNYQLTS